MAMGYPGSALRLIWVVGSMLFSWYVAKFGNYDETYGSLGAAIGFMTWIWLSTIIVLLGAEINAEPEHQTARTRRKGRTAARRARRQDGRYRRREGMSQAREYSKQAPNKEVGAGHPIFPPRLYVSCQRLHAIWDERGQVAGALACAGVLACR